jgi:uncharacterized protein (DUF2141 family)
MPDVSEHHQPPGAASPRRRALRVTLASVLAIGLLGVAASAAQAEPTVGNAELTCKKIVVTYSGFPDASNNTIKEKVRIDGVKNAVTKTFVFSGPEGTDTIFINLPPGEHSLDLFSIWRNSNGVSGNRDQGLGRIKCENAEPELQVEKLQKYSNKTKYTKELLKLGHEGNIVNYEIIVRNSGNVPLAINPSDLGCDGPLTGGQPTLARGESTTFFCSHTLTKADVEAELRCNTATVEGQGEGGPVTAESNTVCVELPNPKTNSVFSCKTITVNLSGFPNATNTVKIKITIDKEVVVEEFVTFTGSSHSFTYEVNLKPGHHSVDVFVTWKTNGFAGNRDQTLVHGIECPAEPNFSIEKLQKIEGRAEPFSTGEPVAVTGETVDYEIVITNTGNTPLTFGPLEDPKCDEGTIEGGPGANPLEPAGVKKPAGTTIFFCKHTLTLLDQIAGEYTNTASEAGSPPEGPGPPPKESNTVRVIVGS